MFCGIVDSTRTAAVLLFDLRSTSGAVRKLRAAARQRQPVHGICHTENDRLLCATMGGVWGWEGGTTGGEVGVETIVVGCDGGLEQKQEQTATQLQIQVSSSKNRRLRKCRFRRIKTVMKRMRTTLLCFHFFIFPPSLERESISV